MSARLDKARSVADALAGLDETCVRTFIEAAEPFGLGIGGTTKMALLSCVLWPLTLLRQHWIEFARHSAGALT